jgi:hypothetical protein
MPPLVLFVALAGAACSSSDEPEGGSGAGPSTVVPATSGSTTVPATSSGPSGTGSPGTGTGSTGSGTSARSPLDNGFVSVGEPSRASYCAGNGPPASLLSGATTSAATCETGLATQLFQHGLCACRDATFTGAFAIDALDSSPNADPGRTPMASVGINGALLSAGTLDLRGSLVVAGGGLTPITSGTYNIEGNFETRGDVITTGANITFGRDLWVDGDITAVGFASVAGDVHQTPGHTQTGMTVGGTTLTETFTVPDPCACEEHQLLDIAAIVAAGRANSHNAELGLGDDALIRVGLVDALALDCGRFAFAGGFLVGDVRIEAHGRTALFIDGDLAITGSFGVDLGTEGELDVFVTGNLLLTGAGEVGSIARPAALRFYVGGAGDIAITGANRFAANLYAPRAAVFVTGADDIHGAFFVGTYHATGAQFMHYDAAILRDDGGPGCEEVCDEDLACGSPQVCEAGSCIPLVDVH